MVVQERVTMATKNMVTCRPRTSTGIPGDYERYMAGSAGKMEPVWTEEILQFAEEKKRKTMSEADEVTWREGIRKDMEDELDRRVREALETPPLEAARRRQQHSKDGRNLDDLERLNAHVTFNMSDRDREIRHRRWKVVQAKRRMKKFMMSSSQSSLSFDKLDREAAQLKMELLLAGDSSSGALESFDDDLNYPSFGMGFDPINPIMTMSKIKSQEHYAKIMNKALTSFASLTDHEKHEFFYAFTKNGFKDALRTGRLPDGSELTHLGSGRYQDKFGIIRDEHGPFWPRDYGPLYPTPVHKRPTVQPTELLMQCIEEKNRRTADNQQTSYTGKWRGVQIVYDSDRTNKDCESPPVSDGICPSLKFESRFECGNLRQARRVGMFEYELVLKTDLYTRRHTQWYYFRVQGTVPGITYKFKIINLLKKDSLYNHGMRPLIYSEKLAKSKGIGWVRQGHHIVYSRNQTNLQCPYLSREMVYHMLEVQLEFPHANDTYFMAHCYPYTYSDLKNDLDKFQSDPVRSKVMKRDVLCETIAGNSCFLLTVTNFDNGFRNKKGVVVTARVHPGETNSSWMMRGLLEYVTGSSQTAKELRDRVVFKIVPMLNPDGVIVGNYRCSLAGRDLNRNYRHPRQTSFPTVYHTKVMMEEFGKHHEIVIYCDLHGHSRKQNVFMYGCNVGEQRSISDASPTEVFLKERLFPWLMAQKAPDKFWFHGCKFQIKKCKESTGRVVMFRQLQIDNSFTMEATFCGTTICKGEKRHFNTIDFMEMGRVFCEVVLDYDITKSDKEKEQEAIVNVARVITHQILESRRLLPPDMPDFTTEAGKEKIKEYGDKNSDTESVGGGNQVTAAFLGMFSSQSHTPTSARRGDASESDDGGTTGTDEMSCSDTDVPAILDSMSKPSVDGCIRLLEHLNLQDSMMESDSSDSDSESEPEMKWTDSKSRRKKKRKKTKKKAKDGDDRPKSATGLPALKTSDVNNDKKKGQNLSMKQVTKNYPTYINKYSNRSNGGIPCFSEERLLERAQKRITDTRKKMDEHNVRRDSLGSYEGSYLEPGLAVSTSGLARMTASMELRQQFHQVFQEGMPIHIRTGVSQRATESAPLQSDTHDQRRGEGLTSPIRPMSTMFNIGRPPGNMVIPRTTGGMIITSAVQNHGNQMNSNQGNSGAFWDKLPMKTTQIPRSLPNGRHLPQCHSANPLLTPTRFTGERHSTCE